MSPDKFTIKRYKYRLHASKKKQNKKRIELNR